MPSTLTFTGKLTITTCWCGIQHAVPSDLYQYTKAQRDRGEQQMPVFCPLGHSWIHGKPERSIKDVEAELAAERAHSAQVRAALEAEERAREIAQRRAAAARGQVTKLKKRATNGICPCCNRTFVNVQRHMQSKHPDQVQ